MKYCWVWQLIKTSSIVALNVVANPATGWEAIVTSRGFPAELVFCKNFYISYPILVEYEIYKKFGALSKIPEKLR